MALLEIPPPIIDGLKKIAALNKKSYQEFYSSLQRIPLRIRQHRIFDDFDLTLETIPAEDARRMREGVFGMYLSRVSDETPAATFADDIIQSLKGDEEAKWNRSEATRNEFKERLIQILSISTLEMVAKAHDVLLEHSQTFAKARIVTDIRPVFMGNVEDSPSAAVIVQMLNVDYRQSGRRQEFAVALDVKDIELLMDALDRAKTKAATLKTVLEQANVPYIDVV